MVVGLTDLGDSSFLIARVRVPVLPQPVSRIIHAVISEIQSMVMKHNHTTAKRFLKLIASTRQGDKKVSFACGQYADTRVLLISRKRPKTARSLLPGMLWDGPHLQNVKKGQEVKALTHGIIDLEGTTLTVRCVKHMGAAGLSKVFRLYFKKNFKLTPPWSKIHCKKMSEADESAFVELDEEDGDPLGDHELEALQLSLRDVESDELVDDWDGADQPAADDDGSLAASDGEETDREDAARVLNKDPKESLLGDNGEVQLRSVVANGLRLADLIGLPDRPSEDDLFAKLTVWLNRMLVATDNAQREATLWNALARLTLALSSVENFHDIQHIEKSKKGPDKPGNHTEPVTDAAGEDGKILDGRIDLAEITTDNVSPEEVVDALLEYGVAEVRRRLLPYDPEHAVFDKIDKIVRSGWPREAGEAQLKAIERLKAALQSAFIDDGRLIHYLGLEKYKINPPAYGSKKMEADELLPPYSSEVLPSYDGNEVADLENATIPPAITAWKQAHTDAKVQVDSIKAAVEKFLEKENSTSGVAALGGSWAKVENVFLQVDVDKLAQELQAVVGKVGSARLDAIKRASATVDANIAWLTSNEIVRFLDNPPFPEVQSGMVGLRLQDGLKGVAAALNQLGEASGLAPAR
jgi:hypothetical protein